MAALIAALNTPPIRRLRRTWEQVNPRLINVLDDLEKTLDSGKNFTGYRNLLASVSLPCVPFIGSCWNLYYRWLYLFASHAQVYT